MQDKTYRRGNIFCGILLKKSIYNRKEKHMKVRKLKTKIAAFGLAVLMGISTLSSANAFAAEQARKIHQLQQMISQKQFQMIHLQWKPVWKESIMMQKKKMLRL